MAAMDLSRAAWRKSTYSNNGGSCVEVARGIPDAAVLAAEPTAMPRSMSRRLQTGPVNSSSADWLRRVLVWWRNSFGLPARNSCPPDLGR